MTEIVKEYIDRFKAAYNKIIDVGGSFSMGSRAPRLLKGPVLIDVISVRC